MFNFPSKSELECLKHRFYDAQPFPYVILDDFLDSSYVELLADEIVESRKLRKGRNRDLFFAKNKSEINDFEKNGPVLGQLWNAVCDVEFTRMVQFICDDSTVFLDQEFHGGGLHVTESGGFLDRHVDFNCHPVQKTWERRLNVLLYLNPRWCEEWGGELFLNVPNSSGPDVRVSPLSGRLVIMETSSRTVHGVNQIEIPSGYKPNGRLSLAMYFYSSSENEMQFRSTVWHGVGLKGFVGRHIWRLVSVKNKMIGNKK